MFADSKTRIVHFPWYVFMLWVYPALFYFIQNRFEVEWYELVRPLIASLLVCVAAIGVCYLVVKNRDMATLLSIVVLFFVFAFPIAYAVVALWIVPEVAYQHFMIAWCALGAMAFVLAVRGLSCLRDPARLTPYLNLFTATLCGVQLAMIAPSLLNLPAADASYVERHARWAESIERQSAETDLTSTPRKYPDIYMLILDGYARGDILQSRFGFDNQPFVDELRKAGFFVGERSHSNYPWTPLSLSATLNCEYLDDLLPDDFDAAAPNDYRQRGMYVVHKLCKEYVHSNRVRRLLEDQGYQWHTTRTGIVTPTSEGSISNVFLGPPMKFEELILQRTILEPLLVDATIQGHWLSAMDRFVDLADRESPKFVLSHVISPHRPFCFDENGGEVKRHPVYDATLWVEDCHAMTGYDDYFRENYPKNVAGLNIHVLRCIKALLAKTKGKAIIIVQADHGSELGFYPRNPAETDMPERFGILNAIYLPEEYSRDGLYNSISAVNTFRVILSKVFGAKLDSLEDRAWFSGGGLELIEVTDQVRHEADEDVETSDIVAQRPR